MSENDSNPSIISSSKMVILKQIREPGDGSVATMELELISKSSNSVVNNGNSEDILTRTIQHIIL